MTDREKYLKSFVKASYPLEELFIIKPEQETLIRKALQIRHQATHRYNSLERDLYGPRNARVEQLLANLYPVYYYHNTIESFRRREEYIAHDLKKIFPLSYEEIAKKEYQRLFKEYYQYDLKKLGKPYDEHFWNSFCRLLTDDSDLGISMFLDKVADMLVVDKQYLIEHNIKGIELVYGQD